MFRIQLALGVFVSFLASSSVAFAVTTSCPPVSGITQIPSGDGFIYSARVDGIEWTGEHPRATSAMLRDLRFDVAYLHVRQGIVTCDYRADPKFGGGLRLTVTKVKSLRGGSQWAPEALPNGRVLSRCSATDPTQCTFDIVK